MENSKQKQNGKLQYFPFNLTSQRQVPSFFSVLFQVSFRQSIWVLNYNSPNALACNSLGWTRFHYCSRTRPISLDSVRPQAPNLLNSTYPTYYLWVCHCQPSCISITQVDNTAYGQKHHNTLSELWETTPNFSKFFQRPWIIQLNRWDTQLKSMTIIKKKTSWLLSNPAASVIPKPHHPTSP